MYPVRVGPADYNQPAVLLHSAADVRPFYCAACVAIASILPPVADAAKAVPTFANRPVFEGGLACAVYCGRDFVRKSKNKLQLPVQRARSSMDRMGVSEALDTGSIPVGRATWLLIPLPRLFVRFVTTLT